MIEMFNAFTEEADSPELAADDIRRALAGAALSKNSVGVIHCHPDFVDSGAVAAVCGALPFDTVGSSTVASSVNGASGKRILTLAVLSGDDVEFDIGVSPEISDGLTGPVEELFRSLEPSPPKMFLACVPFILEIGGDEFIEAIDKMSGGVPLFGTVPVSNDPKYSRRYTIHNGKCYERSIVLMALRGGVEPEFLMVPSDYRNILMQDAIVTSAGRNVLRAVNGMPAVKFFESLGIMENGDVRSLTAVPMKFSSEDNPELIRGCSAVNPDGSLVMFGAVPEGSALSLSELDPGHMLKAVANTMNEVLAMANGRCMLMYSCVWRFWVLGRDAMAEHDSVRARVGDASRFIMAQTGGEIFPARVKNRTVNSFQNNSFVICVL
ncbi:MAG: FIST C-terminal domain-containing protein [Synergistaceae bacterium]|jgi:hypothetical protein|nr:FIST C-terminal domain-containing protein [Synergistaceae bacterium]